MTGISTRPPPSADGIGGAPWITRVAVGLALVTLLPLAALIITASTGSSAQTIAHYADTVLWEYILNTVGLVGLVALGVFVMGVATAWLVTMCAFPGRAVFAWALVLPLAMPAYVCAYAYTYLLQHPGPVQTGLRSLTGWGPREYWFPDIRSLEGAAFVLAMVLYPYVYLLARAAFLQQSSTGFEAARTLGRGPWRAFAGVALPLARPALAAGVALAVMETLADYGTVAHFGVQTFTTAIYRTWFSMGDRIAAVQFSLILVAFVLLAIGLERFARGNRRFAEGRAGRPMPRQELKGWHAVLAVLACLLPILCGFLLPAVTLFVLGLWVETAWFEARNVTLIKNTLVLATSGALITLAVAVVIAYARRLSTRRATHFLGALASFGYAVPGAVIAVGLLIPFGTFDRWLNGVMTEYFGIRTGLFLTGTVAAILFAYVVRFLAVSLNGVEAGFARVAPSLDGAARTLGAGPLRTFGTIHTPLLRGALLTAFLITFVDIMKELPATLILRPFNFDTLAIRAYRLASDERLEMASVPSLFIVLVGLLPVILLSWQIARRHGDTPAQMASDGPSVLRDPAASAVLIDVAGPADPLPANTSRGKAPGATL